MLAKFKQLVKRFLLYLKAINGVSVFYCVLDDLMNKENIREIKINNVNIRIRTNTPDLDVAISSLFYNEYGCIRFENPKFIVDAGANIGTSSISFAEKYPNSQIIALEPEQGNFNMLLENTKRYKNIKPIKAALWGSSGSRVLQNRFTGHWGYTICDTTNSSKPMSQNVKCLTIGEIMNTYKIDRINILKMDVEGGEKEIFNNSSSWINLVDVLVVELHDRICMGCDRAFYLATKNFKVFEKYGEKVLAYRKYKYEVSTPDPNKMKLI